MMPAIIPKLMVLAVIIVIFLMIREFWCWYFKLNLMVESLGRINETIEEKLGVLIKELRIREARVETDERHQSPEGTVLLEPGDEN